MIIELLTDKIFISVVLAWLVCQIIKVLTTKNIKRIYATGGMPSAHTAAAIALVLSIYLEQKAITTIFILALFIAVYTIQDAVYVRRKSGEHAKALNEIVKGSKFEELIGHTPTQGIVGAVIGILITLLVHLA